MNRLAMMLRQPVVAASFVAAATLMLMPAAPAAAYPVRLQPDYGSAFVAICVDANTTVQVAALVRARRREGDFSYEWLRKYKALKRQGQCVEDHGSRVRVLTSKTISTGDATYDLLQVAVDGQFYDRYYVLERNAVPITERELESAKGKRFGR
ncbi:hypothetical protein [Trinickia fusca]|uniref:Uncharacterized protein n=1 Tax=Trinickia fusca TaxID=2419777 RepID=A0A494XE91_9BURK|nr:hypothetical protein [Trinickia fusca]RKP49107.1 hypothetical protein D7S89_09910 [Trinickia fusca]